MTLAASFNRKDQASVDTLRLLAADMVETAKSGHPGLPLGAAPLAYVLWTRFLKHDPARPDWPDRDRFILSPGHGSALLYAWLHLAGYGLTLDDLKNFRQWASLTPGHPERGLTPGVEATTGPLGHGFAMGVGLAMAERALAERFNRPDLCLFDHYTYALVSDGDLMEGVSSEAASFAGTQRLGKLVYVYDDNQITIEGRTDITFTEDVRERFMAYGWQVIVVSDGEDLAAVQLAVENARAETERPTLIQARTVIGAGSPKRDSSSAHGEPLGPEAMAATRAHYGYGDKPPFFVDERVSKNFKQRSEAHRDQRVQWEALLADYGRRYPDLFLELTRRLRGDLPDDLAACFDKIAFAKDKPVATRAASGTVINAIAPALPELLGGSADLAPSNKTKLEGLGSMGPLTPGGRNVHYGIREQAMGAVMNGLAVHGGIIPFGGTFLVFSDFLRPALRLSALMELKVVYVLTHDSVGVGEDGPTHQPIEHLAALRAIPDLRVFRPADAYETLACWKAALEAAGPSALILSRQNLPVLHPEIYPAVTSGPYKGGYVLEDSLSGPPEAIILATGSEVSLALSAKKLLDGKIRARVASFPSLEVFQAQDKAYRDSVLPPNVKKRLSVEAGRSQGWDRLVGDEGLSLSIETFGRSAPAERIFKEFGFTPENAAKMVESLF
ncbi:MAG: transketolase [Deltaproteobacteria bacterium]|jgi:transketolase|nr:transketolase [Deltaproteobacteria bacterium]